MAVVLKTRKREVGAASYKRGSEGSHLRPVYKTKMPPCQNACPSGTDIRGFLTSVAQSQMFKREYDESFEQAWRKIANTNPIPAIIGRVCPHFCETDCNRNAKDEAVSINQVERYLGDFAIEHNLKHEKIEDAKKEKIAVIGSGPAGLSCAFQLARRGYAVTIFEAAPKSGGMLRYGIPTYRLPEEIIDAEVAAIADLGVDIKYGTKVGKDVSYDGLKKDYDAVYIGIGAQIGWMTGVPGEEGEGVLNAVDFLGQVNDGVDVGVSGKKVLIVGGGFTAMDVARSSKRLGASEVTVVYRRTREEMPADDEEIEDAMAEGVNIEYLVAPVEVIRDGGKVTGLKVQKMELGEPDESGRRRPVPVEGSEHVIDADMVVPAIGQGGNFDGLEQFKDEKGWITVDEATGMTSEEGAYAGGDITNRLGTVTEAIGLGRKAAEAIDLHMKGEEIPKAYPMKLVKSDQMALHYYAEKPREQKQHISVSEREGNFNEVTSTWSDETTIEETTRCMSCGLCFDCGNCYQFCSYNAVKKIPEGGQEGGDRYKFALETCVGCAKCAEECPCAYIDMS